MFFKVVSIESTGAEPVAGIVVASRDLNGALEYRDSGGAARAGVWSV